MIIFYDPNTNNQIKAIYIGDTTSTVWAARGYTRLGVTDPAHIAQILSNGQDLQAVVSGGVLESLESWPRPVLSASLNPVPADGVVTSTITATFADPAYAEDVKFSVEGGTAMVVAASGGQAILVFGPVEIVGQYQVRCDSPTYGESRITMEASDA